MPEMDGIETTINIRKNKADSISRLPIIAITAGVSKQERDQCLDAGMNDFLPKPIDKNALTEIIKKYGLPEVDVKETEISVIRSNIHFDFDVFSKKLSNNEQMLNDFLKLSLTNFPQNIQDLELAINQNNTTNIKLASHTLKGSAANMEFKKLSEIASIIEQSNMKPLVLQKLFKTLIEEWKLTEDIIKSVSIK